MKTRKVRSAMAGLGVTIAMTALLVGCGPALTVQPLTVSDPFSLAQDGVTIDLSYAAAYGRFVGIQTHGFSDFSPALLPLAPTGYTLTLAVAGATVSGVPSPPATFTIDNPGATVELSDPSGTTSTLDLQGDGTPWTLDRTTAGDYVASGTAYVRASVTDASTLANLTQLLTSGGDNTVKITLGGVAPGLPSGARIQLEFGAGSEVFDFGG